MVFFPHCRCNTIKKLSVYTELSLFFLWIWHSFSVINRAAASLVTPQLFTSIPYFEEWAKSNSWLANKNLAGIVQSSLYSLFFALCPLLFKAIANAGSNAPSVVTAEDAAINYFWVRAMLLDMKNIRTTIIKNYSNILLPPIRFNRLSGSWW